MQDQKKRTCQEEASMARKELKADNANVSLDI